MNQNKIEKNVKLLHCYTFWENFILFYPVKVLFFAEVSGSFASAMSLFAIQNIAGALSELPTGFLSDKWGRKWVCRSGAFVMLVAFILYAVADNYWILFLGACLNGLSGALVSGNNDALLYDTLVQMNQKEDYHRQISKNISFLQLSLGISSLLGAGFAFISLRAVMIASIIPAAVAFIITLGLIEPKVQNKPQENVIRHIWSSLKYIWKHQRLKYFTCADMMHYGLNEAAFDFNSVFFKQFVPEWTLGIFRSFGHFVNSFANYMSFFITQKIGIKKTILLGAFLDNFICLISVLVASVLSPILKTATAFCNGMKDPAFDALFQNDCNDQHRATILSVLSLLECIFYSVCAISIGILADMTSPYTAMLSAYLLALFSNGLYVKAFQNNGNICQN